jgi:spoIIIJ-associated protein
VNKTIEKTGRTVDEAVKNSLDELNVTRDKVDIEVLDQGSKGLFGLLGSKLAKVRVTVKYDYTYEAKTFLRNVLNAMDIKAEINTEETQDGIKITLRGPNMGILIGHRGETLDSLQYLVSLVINKDCSGSQYKRVVLDTENYRQKREETLKRLAQRLAQNAKATNKSIVLEPMNPYERRIIHAALQDNPYVKTRSEGEEPFRKVVIELKK